MPSSNAPRPGMFVRAGMLMIPALALVAGCSSTSPTAPSGSVTLLVDPTGAGDYTSIQPALSAASSGDTVLVAPGTYTGSANRDLDFGGQNIVLMTASGRDSVVIDCQGLGRGFYLHSGEGAGAVIDGFVVTNGYASRGGGAYLSGASPTIRNVVFVENAAEDDGGGMYLRSGASPSLSGVTFERNTVAYFSGGGLSCDPGAQPTLSYCSFIENESSSGGGMACIFSDPTLLEVSFVRNYADFYGGGLYCGGSSPALDEVTFLGNSGRNGGGAAFNGSSPSLLHATIVNNESIDGGGIFCENGSSPTIRRSIIALNLGEGSVYCAGLNDPDTQQTCLYGNYVTDTPCGTHSDNLYQDPLFCDLGADDITLCANSPCLPDGNDWGLRLGDKGEGCEDCVSSRSLLPPPSPRSARRLLRAPR